MFPLSAFTLVAFWWGGVVGDGHLQSLKSPIYGLFQLGTDFTDFGPDFPHDQSAEPHDLSTDCSPLDGFNEQTIKMRCASSLLLVSQLAMAPILDMAGDIPDK